MMKTPFRFLLAFALLVSLGTPLFADTIRLKDGSVIHGQVIGFKDQQFTILIGGGSKGRRSQTTIYVEDIESIEFDNSGGTGSVTAVTTDTTIPSRSIEASQPGPASNSAMDPSTPNPFPAATAPPTRPTFYTIKASLTPQKLQNGWATTGLVLKKGQRFRITSSGRVALGKDVAGKIIWSTAEGLANVLDADKLMANENTGALIAVIGDDNNDFLLIGASRELVAKRDGTLFLGVNQGERPVTAGSYEVVIEAEPTSPNLAK